MDAIVEPVRYCSHEQFIGIMKAHTDREGNTICYGEANADVGADPTNGRADFLARFRAARRYDPTSSQWVCEQDFYDKLAPLQFPATKGHFGSIAAAMVIMASLITLVWAFMHGG